MTSAGSLGFGLFGKVGFVTFVANAGEKYDLASRRAIVCGPRASWSCFQDFAHVREIDNYCHFCPIHLSTLARVASKLSYRVHSCLRT